MQTKLQLQISKYKLQIIIIVCNLYFGTSSYSQCAMCRASLESSGEKTQAEAVNDGIVYLMIIPYILVGLIGIYIYRMYRNRKNKDS